MVRFYRFEIVEIVDHDSEGLLQASRRKVRVDIDALQPRTVIEVKARDRIATFGRGVAREENRRALDEPGLILPVERAVANGRRERLQIRAVPVAQGLDGGRDIAARSAPAR